MKAPPAVPPEPAPVAEPKVFLPTGRIGVCAVLFRGIISFTLLSFFLSLIPADPTHPMYPARTILTLIILAFMLITYIKRAHDMGYSAVGVILLCALPFLFLLPGFKGTNKYGPVPTSWF